MPKPVAKKKKGNKTPEERYAREIEKAWQNYKAQVDERFEWAERVFKRNDQKTDQAIEDMMEVMTRMSQVPHPPRVVIRVPFKNGKGVHEFPRDVPPGVHEKTLYYCCAAICVALYEWGIRLANFKPPKKLRSAPGRES